MEIANELKKMGLSEKEASIYLACLRLGPASITEIAKISGLKRPTVYLIIDNLLEKDLVHRSVKGKRIYYLATKPENLISLLEGKISLIKNILPNLEALYPSPIKQPQIRFYQGKNGLKNIYEEIFSSSSNIKAIVSLDKFFQVFSERENAYFFELLKKSGARIYDLIENSSQALKYAKAYYRKGLSWVKILPENFKITTDILIFGKGLALISFENLTGLIIENIELAQTHRQIFKFLWSNC